MTLPTRDAPITGGLLGDVAREDSRMSAALLSAARAAADHSVYSRLTTLPAFQKFMTYQVWCVWDFMCLAKSVQIGIGCYSVPWIPPKNPSLVSLMGEIIRGEESDVGPGGEEASHFEIFIQAMDECGAESTKIKAFIDHVGAGTEVLSAMRAVDAPPAAQAFVSQTLAFCSSSIAARIGAFSLGREELVPRMLSTLINRLDPSQKRFKTFDWYLRRHISLDATNHAPKIAEIFRQFVGSDPALREEGLEAGLAAIRARCTYLDALEEQILSDGF